MDMGFWGGPGSAWWGAPQYRRRKHGLRRLRRGILKFALLKLLAEVPRHGYDLIREVREKGWGAGAGSVYPILAALEAAGLIAGREEGDRRIYEITAQGRRLLGEHAAELERFLREDDGDTEPSSDPLTRVSECAGKLMLSISALGASSKPETLERVVALLDGARKEIYTMLAAE